MLGLVEAQVVEGRSFWTSTLSAILQNHFNASGHIPLLLLEN
jgi:hypothetical protein